jgi:hypothetical protein
MATNGDFFNLYLNDEPFLGKNGEVRRIARAEIHTLNLEIEERRWLHCAVDCLDDGCSQADVEAVPGRLLRAVPAPKAAQ